MSEQVEDNWQTGFNAHWEKLRIQSLLRPISLLDEVALILEGNAPVVIGAQKMDTGALRELGAKVRLLMEEVAVQIHSDYPETQEGYTRDTGPREWEAGV